LGGRRPVPRRDHRQGALAEVIGPRATVAAGGVCFVLVLVLLRARGSLAHLDDEVAQPLIDPV
jgi:hypothetical protein